MRGPVASGRYGCRIGSGALHAQPHLRRAGTSVRRDSQRQLRPHGSRLAGADAQEPRGPARLSQRSSTTAVGAVSIRWTEFWNFRKNMGSRAVMLTRPTAATSQPRPAISGERARARPMMRFPAQTPSSSIRTSMVCSHCGCGAVLFRDPTGMGRLQSMTRRSHIASKELHLGQISLECSRAGRRPWLWATRRVAPCELIPFTYFTSKELHLRQISLHECSRAGASAVALWATQRFAPVRGWRRVRARVGGRTRGCANDVPKTRGGSPLRGA